MRIFLLLLVVFGLFPLAGWTQEPFGDCVQALEQIETLQTTYPVYRLEGADHRHFIEDAQRPAEIARLQKIVTTSCSTDARVTANERAAAERLHQALSPLCAVARDTLAAMERPSAHETADRIATQRQLVTSKCPPVDSSNKWLLQWNCQAELQPDNP
jgi:hypothetical protein